MRALVLVVALMATASAARADERPSAGLVCQELPCSVNRNCSSTGIACDPQDRDCTERARARNLEVKCEQQCTGGQRLVYCPPDTGRSESNIVWILLALALALAVSGTSVAWVVLRKKSA